MITSQDGLILKKTQEYVNIIEAMLMIAKEYVFKEVEFKNTKLDYLGPYELNNSIKTPELINPIYIMSE